MSQKLILPINKCVLTASMKTAAYKNKYGYEHYGADMVSSAGDRILWASGNGTVVATGNDNVVGNVVAVMYPDAVNHRTGEFEDIVLRYFHLQSIEVKTGQTVTKDTKLGIYGNTGMMQMANHLHLEADTDTEHPVYSPTVLSSSFLKGRSVGANDITMTSPLDWLHTKADAPDYQQYTTVADEFIDNKDKTIPAYSGKNASDDGRDKIDGIDVSEHNGIVDFAKVAASGIKFVFIRLGWAGWDGAIEENNGLDSKFHDNIKAAIAAGMHVGVYVYSYCKTEEAAKIAALETMKLVEPYSLEYPIAFDIEDTSDSGTRYDKMSKADNTAIAKAFLSTIKEANYSAILYTYTSFAENFLDMSALKDWDLWIAQYAGKVTYKGDYSIWQYKGDAPGFIGSCEGVSGSCDLNYSYKDYAEIIKSSGLNEPLITANDCNCASEVDVLQKRIKELEEQVAGLSNKLAQIHQLSS